MPQIKIYGVKKHLNPIQAKLSDVIHSCVVDALSFPEDKRSHRIFALEAEDFYYPLGRSPRYTILEITMIAGRSLETKKNLIRLLFERIKTELNLAPADLEIAITEIPIYNWGFRGQPGDEVTLNYKIEV